MTPTIRVPTELYQTLQEIKVSLESEHFSAAPTMQDLVSVSVKRFIRDWNNPKQQKEIIEELLKNRQDSRSKMGRRKLPHHPSEE